MSVRPMKLPLGWYPSTAEAIREQLVRWDQDIDPQEAFQGVAGIVPHAGWQFSGALAYRVLRSLRRSMDTLILAGGHLGVSSTVHCMMEDFFETPLGDVEIDSELRDSLAGEIPLQQDNLVDNTVEVHMPLVMALYPDVKVLLLRLPPQKMACDVGRFLAEECRRLGRDACFVGSTDLTHYGPSYDFAPMGTGHKAVQWVRQENDGAILQAMTALDHKEVIRLGTDSLAACSAGAAAAAMAFAETLGTSGGILLDYQTSMEKHPSDSFVGYGGVVYQSTTD